MNIKRVYTFLLCWSCCFAMLLRAQSGTVTPVLKTAPLSMQGGADAVLSISMENTMAVTAFQFTLRLPAGVEPVQLTEEGGETAYDCALSARKKSSHTLEFTRNADGTYLALAFSSMNAAFSGTSGELLRIGLRATKSIAPGNYSVWLSKTVLTAPDGTQWEPASASSVLVIEEPPVVNFLTMADLSVTAGTTFTLPVSLENADQITAFQFRLLLPEGITVAREAEGDGDPEYAIALSERKSTSHLISYTKNPDGSFLILAFSSKSAPFKGNSGTLLNVKLVAEGHLHSATYHAGISDITLESTTSGVRYTPKDFRNDLFLTAIPNAYRVTTALSLPNSGTTFGDGVYAPGTLVTAKVTPKAGFRFLNWQRESGQVVSSDAAYTFTVSEAVTLTARMVRLGDSDSDGSVDVFDATNTVNYIIEQTPPTFDFDAADVSPDFGTINVADVIGIIDIVLNPTVKRISRQGAESPASGSLFLEGGQLKMEASVPVAGFDFAYTGELKALSALSDFNVTVYSKGGRRRVMAYGIGKKIPARTVALFDASGTVTVEDLLFVDAQGVTVPMQNRVATSIGQVTDSWHVSLQRKVLRVSGSAQVRELIVVNAAGCVMLRSRSQEADLSELPASLYMVRVMTDKGEVVKKIILRD